MTEMGSEISQSSNTTISPSVDNSSTPDHSYTPAKTEEKLFKQSEVNDIIKRAKYGAVEDFKRMSAERPEYVQQKNADHGIPHQNQQTSHSTQYLTPDDVRRMAVEESQRLRDEWLQDAHRKTQEQDAQRIVNGFFTKLSTGKEKYEDFDKVTGDVDYGCFPNVVQLLNHLDNTADIMYELGKDRSKLAVLEQLCHMSPRDAAIQAQRLSQSIKDNENARKIKYPNEPLSQMRPSNTGTDNGVLTVRDYKAKYKA